MGELDLPIPSQLLQDRMHSLHKGTLVIELWSGLRASIASDRGAEASDVGTCFVPFHSCQQHWPGTQRPL